MQVALLFSSQRRILVTLPFCAVIVYFIQKIYLRTSRQLRFLELESRSAVYSSFLETVCSNLFPYDALLRGTDRRHHDNPRIRLAKQVWIKQYRWAGYLPESVLSSHVSSKMAQHCTWSPRCWHCGCCHIDFCCIQRHDDWRADRCCSQHDSACKCNTPFTRYDVHKLGDLARCYCEVNGNYPRHTARKQTERGSHYAKLAFGRCRKRG